MRALTLTLLASFCLAGCAAKLIDSNPRQVVVKAGHAHPEKALAMANSECARHGRSARLNQRDPEAPIWYFDCV